MPVSKSSGDPSPARDATRASIGELREFVASLRGKKPHEMLGRVANSGLVQGIAISTLVTIVIMAVFTAGPYFLYGKPVPLAKSEKPIPAAEETTAKPAAEAAATTPNADPKATPQPTKANAQKTLDALGESETKTADPNVVPLDVDNILDMKK